MKEACVAIVALATLGLVGCGGAAVPHSQMADSEAAVRAAEVKDAARIPKGDLHLRYAQDQIKEAEALIDEGENETAELVLRRAEADAAFALALAQANDARDRAQKAKERIEDLQNRQ
jgi:hypothetical protein